MLAGIKLETFAENIEEDSKTPISSSNEKSKIKKVLKELLSATTITVLATKCNPKVFIFVLLLI